MRDSLIEPGWDRQEDLEVRGDAEQLAERLAFEPRGRQVRSAHADEAVDLRDVDAALTRFDEQERVVTELGVGFPCIEVEQGPPLPVGVPPERAEHPNSLYGALDELHRVAPMGGGTLREYEPMEARGFLARRLASFLAPRLAGRAAGARAAPPVGYTFTVETPGKSGLRIHCSPAFFLDPTIVFGNTLSTPVVSQLNPGRFVFGAMGPGDAAPTWDFTANYRIPGPPDVAHLI